jgi:adenine-specific DNA-methyltransferase
MARTTTPKLPTDVKVHTHQDTRLNIPPAELEPLMSAEDRKPKTLRYPRNTDLDPQLVWRGKDDQDWSDLVVQAPPLFIQEKVHPKVLIDDLIRQTAERAKQEAPDTPDLFADFNGLPDKEAATEFYQHPSHWTNRMILGDSLAVMASLAEREGLRGKVQAIYFDPPYGIKFNSNFQWSTHSRDVTDKPDHVTREPEMVKAFRDTWKDGIHSYLTYLRDRLTVGRDLLAESGSIFVQIGDQNVHKVRMLLEEVFGDGNFVAMISSSTSGGSTGNHLAGVNDYILWFAKNKDRLKYRQLYFTKSLGGDGADKYNRIRLDDTSSRPLTSDERDGLQPLPKGGRVYRQDNLTSQSVGREKGEGAASWFPVKIGGRSITPSERVRWKTNEIGMKRLRAAERVELTGNSLAYVRFLDDFSAIAINNSWTDIGGVQSRADPKVYVVQTPTTAIQRCLLMATDPGDLVLDPTCGSGTTAYVAETWGRRWIPLPSLPVLISHDPLHRLEGVHGHGQAVAIPNGNPAEQVNQVLGGNFIGQVLPDRHPVHTRFDGRCHVEVVCLHLVLLIWQFQSTKLRNHPAFQGVRTTRQTLVIMQLRPLPPKAPRRRDEIPRQLAAPWSAIRNKPPKAPKRRVGKVICGNIPL